MIFIKIIITAMLSISFISFAQVREDCQTDYVVRPGETLSGIAGKKIGYPVWSIGGTLEQISSCNPQIKDIHLIYPGNSLVLPGLATEEISQEKGKYNDQEEVSDTITSSTSIEESSEIDVEKKIVYEKQDDPNSQINITHSFYAEINYFHSELAATQTTGIGVGSKADEILSDPNFSGKLAYSLNLSEIFSLKAIVDFKNYIYSEDLDTKIVSTQNHLAINPGLGLVYSPYSFFELNFNTYYFEQGFYGANSSAEIVFDFERVFRFEINPEFKVLQKESFDLGFGVFGTYHLDGVKVSSSLGWGAESFVNAFFDKSMRFHVRYYDLSYDFVSSETRNELLELGVGYQWDF